MAGFGRPVEQRVLSVGEFVAACHRLLDGYIGDVWVEGEISNLKIAASGHAYFSLVGPGRQGTAAVDVVLWRSTVARLGVPLANGRQVRVFGRPGIYEKSGRFQLYGQRVREAGVGDRLEALAALRRRLEKDGLLDAARKRPLPRFPRCVGVVTSKRGAALRDIVAVIGARCPRPILVAHARVQGDDAASELRRALARIVREPDVDVVILGRGGGSMEDLWAFNDEALARAIAASPVPVVSAVGHEVDVTAADWVADVRAATPSQAAELVVPDRRDLLERIDGWARRLAAVAMRLVSDRGIRLRELEHRLARHGHRLGHLERRRLEDLATRLERLRPARRVAAARAAFDRIRGRLREAARHRLREADDRLRRDEARLQRIATRLSQPARRRLAAATAALEALDPHGVLARGYAIVLGPDGRAITDAANLRSGDELDLRFHRGRATAEVVRTSPAGEPSDEVP